VNDGLLIEVFHGDHDAILEFLFGCDADVALVYTALWLGTLKASRNMQNTFTPNDQHFWAKFWGLLVVRVILLGAFCFAAVVTILDW
jgi:hypothetical protein